MPFVEDVVNRLFPPGWNGWEPIETAPKDGTLVLLFCPSQFTGDYQIVGLWERGNWRDPDECQPIEATHWMPLPMPPEPVNGS